MTLRHELVAALMLAATTTLSGAVPMQAQFGKRLTQAV
jgi:hypothetical protein